MLRRRNQQLRRAAQTRQFAPNQQNHRPLAVLIAFPVAPSSRVALRMCHSPADTDRLLTPTTGVIRCLPETLVTLPPANCETLVNREITESRTREMLASLVTAEIRATFDHPRRPAKIGQTSLTARRDQRGAIGCLIIPGQQIGGHLTTSRVNLHLVLLSEISQLDRSHLHGGRSPDLVRSAIVGRRENSVLLPGSPGVPMVECCAIHRLRPRPRQLPRLQDPPLKELLTAKIRLARLWMSMTDPTLSILLVRL